MLRKNATELMEGLKKPCVLFIETCSVCNLRCSICPQSLEEEFTNKISQERIMSFETYNRILKSLEGWSPGVGDEKIKTIRFYGTGEPLLSNNVIFMIDELKKFCDVTEITTNGTRLTPGYIDKLCRYGLDLLRVSIYSTSGDGYLKVTGKYIDPLSIRENIKLLHSIPYDRRPHIHVRFLKIDPLESTALFYNQWIDSCDELSIEPIHNHAAGTNLVKAENLVAPVRKLVCPYPFFELAIKVDGSVSPCRADWSGDLVLGNVNNNTLEEIWNGDKMKKLRATHLEGGRDSILKCVSCNVPDIACPDDMDELVKVK